MWLSAVIKPVWAPFIKSRLINWVKCLCFRQKNVLNWSGVLERNSRRRLAVARRDLLITGSDTFSSSWSAGGPDRAAKPGSSCWGKWLSSGSAPAEPVWAWGAGRSWGTPAPAWRSGSFPWCSAPELSLRNRQDGGSGGRISDRPQTGSYHPWLLVSHCGLFFPSRWELKIASTTLPLFI